MEDIIMEDTIMEDTIMEDIIMEDIIHHHHLTIIIIMEGMVEDVWGVVCILLESLQCSY